MDRRNCMRAVASGRARDGTTMRKMVQSGADNRGEVAGGGWATARGGEAATSAARVGVGVGACSE